MKRAFISVSMTCIALGLFSVRGWALGEIGSVQSGAFVSAAPIQEQLVFGDTKIGMNRQVIQIPAAYGNLVTIIPSEDATVLWFQADDGTIRNVRLESSQMILVQRRGTTGSTR